MTTKAQDFCRGYNRKENEKPDATKQFPVTVFKLQEISPFNGGRTYLETESITLDDEDLKYLYEKYSKVAFEDINTEIEKLKLEGLKL